jgi:DNA polymerase-3 subunit alpha
VINKMGFAGYFLITQDFINAAKERDIPVGLGRGSAAGSIVAYSLGITDIDPLRYDLLFERFLNPERVTMPDIDIDFCVERRDEVIEYVKEKYGRNNVAQIITFGTMASRGVIRDVSRVLEIPISQADMIAKQVPIVGAKPMKLSRAFKEVPELKELAESEDTKMQELIKYSETLEGIARHASVHAAGIIITPDDITNYVPLYKNSDQEITTQWTMGWSEAIGLLKMDFLGLRNLTVIQKTEKLIRERYNTDFHVKDAPLDDPETFKLFGDGLTVGVFQFESSGMQEYLKKLQPSRIEDLIAMNALYRPGPMSMIDDFIDRKFGRKEIEYLHPSLEPILKETYGIIVYQEQVMRIASDLGGFSLAQADLMRRAMGKKKREEMLSQKKHFVEGCKNNGIDEKIANDIADLIERFAEYGFNKSHSAAYAVIAYQTAYLKAHYPAEFMSANLTSEVNNSDRVVILMDECKKLGLTIERPDVNYSDAHFKPIEKDVIAFGMAAIKNVGTNAITSIVEARQQKGNFETIFDLLLNVDLRLVNKKVMESLIQAGALDSLKGKRAQLFNSIETATEFAQNFQGQKNRNLNQRSIFEINADDDTDIDMLSYPELPDIPDWNITEKLKKEKELLGYYISGHPLERFRSVISIFATELDSLNHDENNNGSQTTKVRVGGQITDVRIIFDKKSNKMAFVKLEDFNQSYEAVVFGSIYPQFEKLLKSDNMVMIIGRSNSQPDDNMIKLIADRVIALEDIPAELTESILLCMRPEQLTPQNVHEIKVALQSSPGKNKVYFELNQNGSGKQRFLSNAFKIKLTYRTLMKLDQVLGTQNIKVKMIDA